MVASFFENWLAIIDKLTWEVNDEWCRVSCKPFPTDTASCENTSFGIIANVELEIFRDPESKQGREVVTPG